MTELLSSYRHEIAALCRQYDVLRLELFGSAANGTFDPATSDLDFLVLFKLGSPIPADDRYFGLQESLAALFQRKVDLVDIRAARNPYFVASALNNRFMLYAA